MCPIMLPLIGKIVRFSVNPVGGWLLVAIVALVVLLLVFRGTTHRVSAGRRRWLMVLRLAAGVLLLFALLRPSMVWIEITRRLATLVVLLDGSRSMQVADEVGKRSRWQAAQAALQESLPALQELAKMVQVKVYTFDEKLRPVPTSASGLELESVPVGEQTAMGAALDEMLKQHAGERLVGVVLLGDGAQRANAPLDLPPQVAARRLADLGFKLYTVAFGQARGVGDARDIAVEDLITNQTVYVKNVLPISGDVRSEGFAGQSLAVRLLWEEAPGEMRPVAAQQVTVREGNEQLPYEFSYEPQTPGEYKLTIEVEPQPRELLTTNNRISTFVTVLKGGLNVLYLCGEPLPEQKFIRWALDTSPDIKLDYLYIRANALGTRPPDLMERLQPGKYDVYLIGALDSSAFSREELQRLADTIDSGAGFMMMGGAHSFGAGRYRGTPLERVLPIQIHPTEGQDFGAELRSDLHILDKVQMLPTAIGLRQSLLQLAPGEQNRTAWQQLPPLDGANRFAGLAPGAVVLAETQNKAPLLVAREYGRGRVLAFAGDTTWKWWLAGHQALHKRFWRQTVLWLARKDETAENRVWIKLDQRRFRPGSRVEFSAGAETADGEPVPDAVLHAEIIAPNGNRHRIALRRQAELHLGAYLNTQIPGDYTIVVEARQGETPLGSSRARFLVYEQDLELDNPAADPSLLASLSAITGVDRPLTPEQLPRLLAELQKQTEKLKVETQVRHTLYDNWLLLLAFVALLCTEWYLRKRWGLV